MSTPAPSGRLRVSAEAVLPRERPYEVGGRALPKAMQGAPTEPLQL